jgi:hypothetical protein
MKPRMRLLGGFVGQHTSHARHPFEYTAETLDELDGLRKHSGVVSEYSIALVAVIFDMHMRLAFGSNKTPLAASNLKAQQGHRTTL